MTDGFHTYRTERNGTERKETPMKRAACKDCVNCNKKKRERKLFSLFNTHSADRIKIKCMSHHLPFFPLLFALYLSPVFSRCIHIAYGFSGPTVLRSFSLWENAWAAAGWAKFCITALNVPNVTKRRSNFIFCEGTQLYFWKSGHTLPHIFKSSNIHYICFKCVSAYWIFFCGKFITWFVSSYPRGLE